MGVLYRERLRVPVVWWVIGLVLGVPTMTAIGFMGGPWASLAAGLATVVLVVSFLVWVSGTTITVTTDGVQVGRSRIAWPYIGEVTVLDPEQTRDALGPQADARAWVIQKPWLRQSVKLTVDDAADPHPYWLFSTRWPAQCTAAIERARPKSVKP